VVFETGSVCATQVGFSLEILLPQSPKCWDYRWEPPVPGNFLNWAVTKLGAVAVIPAVEKTENYLCLGFWASLGEILRPHLTKQREHSPDIEGDPGPLSRVKEKLTKLFRNSFAHGRFKCQMAMPFDGDILFFGIYQIQMLPVEDPFVPM
jgi:hypothetical protein